LKLQAPCRQAGGPDQGAALDRRRARPRQTRRAERLGGRYDGRREERVRLAGRRDRSRAGRPGASHRV